MKKYPAQWTETTRRTASVLASGVVGSVVTPGAVYCVEKVTPQLTNHIKRIFAQYVVEPHLEFFEKISHRIFRARREYDDMKRGERLRKGLPEERQDKIPSRKERAEGIASDMVFTFLGVGMDFLTALGVQHFSNKYFDVNLKSSHTAFIEMAGTIAASAAMAQVVPSLSEDLHHGIRRRLERWGVEKSSAESVGVSTAYAAVPGLFATLATLVYAHLAPHGAAHK